MHELRSLNLVGKYLLSQVPRDPILTPLAIAGAATGLGTAGTAAVAAGTAVGAAGTLIGGRMKANAEEEMGRLQQQGAEFQAKQLDQNATESRAASQRIMFDTQRKGRLALSTLVSRAAAGGEAGSTDVIKLGSDIAGRGEYEALADLYTGENRARGLLDEATGKRFTGAAQEYGGRVAAAGTRVGAYFNAAGTILKGAGIMAGKGGLRPGAD